MTPAIQAAAKAGIAYRLHEYQHEAANSSYGMEAAEKLGLDPACVFKTLLVCLNGDPKALAVAVVPVNARLDLKAMAKSCKAKKAAMADPQIAERATGYVVGGISPLGQRRRLATVIDATARAFATVFVSAGRRGMDIELAPGALQQLTGADFAPVARD